MAPCCTAEIINFSEITRLLEKVQSCKGKQSKGDVFVKFLKFWRKGGKKTANVDDSSFFPAMRLLLPHLDKERLSYGMKEVVLAKYYIDALNISKNSDDAQRLLNYRNPSAAKQSAGDFAGVAYTVLQSRCPDKGSLSLAEINISLDEIALANAEHRREDIKKILQKLLRNMSAMEQKWLIRVILKDLKVGLSEKSIFALFHPDAHELYNVCSSLSKVCKDLHDPSIRMSDLEIEIFTPFRPMLGQRSTLEQVEKLMDHQQFYIETKIDGERMQLHKSGDEFKYFSRGSNDYTDSFGATPYRGTLTPFIHKAFKSDADTCILDGEMIAYDNDTQLFISKGTNIDVKASELKGVHPCFVVFDVLLYNGEKLANKPLSERVKVLPKIVAELPGRIQFVSQSKASSKSEVIEALNNAIDLREEGIVVKKPDSVYKPSQRKGSGWLKIKPEYVDSLSDELDLLIVGGYFGSGRRGGVVSHFLLAVSVPPSVKGNKPSVFHSFCKVGSGYTFKELNKLCNDLNPHWRKYDVKTPPTSVILASGFKEKPDVWIEPQNSKIVQIKAAEITPSDRYKCGYTLRFPRVEMVRDDKSWYECLNADELETMRKAGEGHLTYKLVDASSSNDTSNKKKRKAAPLPSRTMGKQFKGADISDISEVSNVFKDKEFCIVNGTQEHNKATLERKIVELGGTFVQNPSSNTYCVVAGKVNLRIKNVIKQQINNVIKAEWLIKSLESKQLLPWQPSDLVFATEDTKETFSERFDHYGDSYTDDVTIDSLRTIFATVKHDIHKLTPDEISEVDEKYFGDKPTSKMFRGCSVYPDIMEEFGNEDSDPISHHLNLDILDMRLHGAIVKNSFDSRITHILVDERYPVRIEKALSFVRKLAVKPHIITPKWKDDSLTSGYKLLERDYRPLLNS